MASRLVACGWALPLQRIDQQRRNRRLAEDADNPAHVSEWLPNPFGAKDLAQPPATAKVKSHDVVDTSVHAT
jgi:hypothetical protein